MKLARRERTVRWTARLLGSLFVFVLLAFVIGETLMPAPDETGEPLTLSWLDYAGLGLMGIGAFGFLLAWWRPLLGGILGLMGLVIPIGLTFTTLPQGGALQVWYMVISPMNIAIVAGILHIVDGVWRRRGIGPPPGRIRENAQAAR